MPRAQDAIPRLKKELQIAILDALRRQCGQLSRAATLGLDWPRMCWYVQCERKRDGKRRDKICEWECNGNFGRRNLSAVNDSDIGCRHSPSGTGDR